MRVTKKISNLIIVGGLCLSSQAMAVSSCWYTWDPIGCWLQCTFGGPCEVDSIASEGAIVVGIQLPSPKSEAYKKVAGSLSKQLKSPPESKKFMRPNDLKQVCKPEELLSVVDDTKLRDAGVILDKCFVEAKSNIQQQLLKK